MDQFDICTRFKKCKENSLFKSVCQCLDLPSSSPTTTHVSSSSWLFCMVMISNSLMVTPRTSKIIIFQCFMSYDWNDSLQLLNHGHSLSQYKKPIRFWSSPIIYVIYMLSGFPRHLSTESPHIWIPPYDCNVFVLSISKCLEK